MRSLPMTGIVRGSVATALAAAIVATGTTSALGFGSLNSFGQNGEHEAVTRVIGTQDPRWQPNSLSLLAGNKGNLGGVGAPDNLWDSGGVTKGSGPAYKHCDDGDFLDAAGYPQTASRAQTAIAECARYYQTLLSRAVRSAGKLVSADLAVNTAVFDITRSTDSASFQPDRVCYYPFSLKPTENPKCDVMNALGRSLHLAEDIHAHSNWADLADPTRPISYKNPPGLGSTTIPGFLRYPVSDIVIPEGLITGCDDTASGTENCSRRVAHSVLAKDNGSITEDGSASPTSAYPRGEVVVNGITNFQRAVTMGRQQAISTWRDFEAAVLATYGEARGGLIVESIVSDQAPTSAVSQGDTGPTSSPDVVEPTSTPSDSTDTSDASGAATASATPSLNATVDAEEREAAAGGTETNIPTGSGTGASGALLSALLATGVGVAVITLALVRRWKGRQA